MMAALSVELQSRKKIIGLVLILSFSMIVAFLVTNKVSAHNDYSPDFVWDYPNVQIYIEGRQSFPYTTQLCQGAADINSNTVISIPNCGYSNTGVTDEHPGDINHFYENYGSQWEFFAGSDPWWWGGGVKKPCFNMATGQETGDCNTGAQKATMARVFWNTFYGLSPSLGYPFLDSNWRSMAVRHETIHAFGISHSSCGDDSVMRPSGCGSIWTGIVSHDIDDLADTYP